MINTLQNKQPILDCYILNGQPTVCGKCGSRTDFEIENNGIQKHQCMSSACGYTFIAVDEEN